MLCCRSASQEAKFHSREIRDAKGDALYTTLRKYTRRQSIEVPEDKRASQAEMPANAFQGSLFCDFNGYRCCRRRRVKYRATFIQRIGEPALPILKLCSSYYFCCTCPDFTLNLYSVC